VHFKGSGFYTTDYGRKKTGGKDESKSSSDSSSDSGNGDSKSGDGDSGGSSKPDKPDKAARSDKPEKPDKDGKKEDKGNGAMPVPLLAGVAGWLPAIRRRLSRIGTLLGAQIRGTARIRQKAKGGLRGPPRKGSGPPVETATSPSARSDAAAWWRTWLGSCPRGPRRASAIRRSPG